MTEKRFTIGNVLTKCSGLRDNGKLMTFNEVVDVLNEQHEENLELKHDNKRLVKFIMSKGYNLKDYLDWLKEEVWE